MNEKPDKRQKTELLVLSSIYSDLEDLNNGNKKKPIDIRIKLEPSHGSVSNYEMLVEVFLHVTCPPLYPDELPNIQLEKSKGLSPNDLKKLEEELKEVALKKEGQESIFDLIQSAKEFLYNHNKKKLLLKEQEKEQKLAEEREKERMARELNEQLTKIINLKKTEVIPYSDTSVENIDSFQENIETCSHESVSSINLGSKKILMGKCLRHYGSNQSIHIGFDGESGKNYTIHEWKINCFNKNTETILKQIRAIEQEFNSSLKSLRHDNLISFYNISTKKEKDHCTVQTVEEHIIGLNCNTLFIKCEIKIGMKYTRYIAKNVLKALDYLHSRNVVHRDLDSSCIYIVQGEIVKVANYATHRRLSDLVGNKVYVSYSKRKDILKFGRFILELVSGIPASEEEEMNIPVSLPPDLYDFLRRCKDEEEQYSAAQLLKHEFITRTSLQLDQGDEESEYPENDLNFEMQRRNLIRHTSTSLDQSRISSEFELIALLGEGAFGSVHKYKNKLDERFYAIKKIQLNTRSRHTIKKIKNEVKLLSRLDHENVVRYYTSWIEEVEEDDSPNSSECSSIAEGNENFVRKPRELSQYDDIEKLAPAVSKNKVSTSYSHLRSEVSSESESSDDDEDDENKSPSEKSESDAIIFQNSENASDADGKIEERSSASEKRCHNSKRTYMYIQMEFCEKSTLRSAIDDTSLCSDEPRVQRHFREILEGLDYIHRQGMIHRDLKPANIFLDMRNRVKIGDFGLATRNLKSKLNEDHTHKSEFDSLKDMGESKTGHIGTFFYVAPEVNANAKAVYNSKVDVYSLGIILFEMCYKPFPTGMERHAVLVELRKKDVNLPKDYQTTLVKKNSAMIRWLLEHDVSKRPTVPDILKSELAPPPIFEDLELFNYMSYTVSNPQTKVYKSLTANLFKQKLPLIKDLTYDYDESTVSFSKSLDTNFDFVKTIAVKVFTNHGAKNMFTPQFMPFSHNYTYQNKMNCVKLMTHGGDIVSIPSDLRVHFARFVAYNSLYLIKRYSVERVFHEQKVFGVSPKGFFECAFDIVTPKPGENLFPDGEILQTVHEILSQISIFNNENVVIHLNHSLLLRAIMLHFGIEQELHNKILEIFCEHENKNSDLNNDLLHSKLSFSQIQSLTGIFFPKTEPVPIPPIVKTILHSKVSESRECGEKAYQDLVKIMKNAEAMGVDFRICIVPGLMYNFQQFSGMICKFLYIKNSSKQTKMETLAAGGRYDAMITHYRNLFRETHLAKNASQSAVGISIFLDKVVQLLQKGQAPKSSSKFADALICLEESWPPDRVTNVLNHISSLQIQWILFQTNCIKEADEYSENLGIPHIILLLKDYNENEIVLKSWNEERSKYREKKYSLLELVEELGKTYKQDVQTNEISINRSESKTYFDKPVYDSLNIVFHIAVSSKNHIESQINSKLDEFRRKYQGPITVLAFNFGMDIINMLAGSLDFQSDSSFHKSVKHLDQRHVKEKKLQEVCEFIYEHKTKSNKPFIILYSLKDSFYRYL